MNTSIGNPIRLLLVLVALGLMGAAPATAQSFNTLLRHEIRSPLLVQRSEFWMAKRGHGNRQEGGKLFNSEKEP